MTANPPFRTIQLQRDTAANWTSANTLLAEGELGLEMDTRKAKIGDWVTQWNSLLYAFAGAGVTIDATPTDGSGNAVSSNWVFDALAQKAPIDSPTFTGTVDGINKGMVGLGNVDNTADTAKPVSSAQQTALNLKANLASPAFTGTPSSAGKMTLQWTDTVGATYAPASGSQTVTLDCITNNMHIVTGNASGTAITFAVSNVTNSQVFIVSVLQGAVVSTIAGWFATVRWAGWIAPTLTATVGKRDTFAFIRTGANTYDGFIIWQNC